MPALTQKIVAKLLKRATSAAEVEEVLGAYLLTKQLKGRNGHQIQRALYLLPFFLSSSGLSSLVKEYQEALNTVLAINIASIAVSRVISPSAPLGLEAWNQVRRPSRGWLGRSSSNLGKDEMQLSRSSLSLTSALRHGPVLVAGQWVPSLSLKPPTYPSDLGDHLHREDASDPCLLDEALFDLSLPSYSSV